MVASHFGSEGLSVEQLKAALRSGVCPSDESFDAFLPDDLRRVSARYWTPLLVAMRLARWLAPLGARHIVDIGSGAGKLCVAAALSGNARFTGIEHRERLVHAATTLAATFGVSDRVRFVHGAVAEETPPPADAYYLFNPFGENLYDDDEHLDEDVELSKSRYARDVGAADQLLEGARVGTILVTYNGYGGTVPVSYREIRLNRHLPEVLRMWQKVALDPPPPTLNTLAPQAAT
jgi:predicted RNA methylase